MQTKSHSLKKKATVGVAVVAIVAMLLTGTFAWTNFVQHKTNPFDGGEWVNVTLNDKYNPHEDWKPSDPAVDKKVSVTNTDESNRTAIVRLQFKEYMEAYDMVPVQEGGKNVLFATYADGANKGEYIKWADVPAGYNYTKYTITYADGTTADFARTSNAELKDGIYGKAMYIQSDLNIYGTANKAQYVHEEQHTDECDYNVHKWDGSSIANRADATDQIADYISWNLGSQVVKMSDWLTSGKPTGNFWVLDDTDSEGWVYWANPLAPGESTSNILESVKLNVMPGAKFEYYIHIDMEALTLDELTRTDAQQKWHGTDTESLNGITNSSDKAKDLFDELKKPTVGWVDNGDGTASKVEIVNNVPVVKETVIIGLDGIPGTADDGAILNPAGEVLKTGVTLSYDGSDNVYVDLGNGFHLYGGADNKIGTGDDVIKNFGSYAQSDATGATKDPIDWLLLDIQGNNAVIISDTVLDNVKFNTTTAAGNEWVGSNLQTWMNGTFYNTAFSTADKAKINTTSITSTLETYSTYINSVPTGNMTLASGQTFTVAGFYTVNVTAPSVSDKVFALSGAEIWNYFGKNTLATTENVSVDPKNCTNAYAKGNAYAKAQGTYLNMNDPWTNNANYWLRSAGKDTARASYVGSIGIVYGHYSATNADIGARPAITVNLVP